MHTKEYKDWTEDEKIWFENQWKKVLEDWCLN